MLSAIRAEWRKLITVRSTYILSAAAVAILGIVCFWVLGFKGTPERHGLLMEAAQNSGITSMFVAIIAILLITHEYRYNTIMYTLTAANRRWKVLAAKFLVVTLFAAVFTALGALLGVGLAWLGVQMGPGNLSLQQFLFWDTGWRLFFGSLAYAWAGLLFGVLLRHVVGALVVFIIGPSLVEQIASLLLKGNAKYLPFTALNQVQSTGGPLSPGKAALVFTAYLVVGYVVAWILFLRRDAN